jgi:hypothetical protein
LIKFFLEISGCFMRLRIIFRGGISRKRTLRKIAEFRPQDIVLPAQRVYLVFLFPESRRGGLEHAAQIRGFPSGAAQSRSTPRRRNENRDADMPCWPGRFQRLHCFVLLPFYTPPFFSFGIRRICSSMSVSFESIFFSLRQFSRQASASSSRPFMTRIVLVLPRTFRVTIMS